MNEDKLNQTASTIQSLLFNAIRNPETFTNGQGRPYSDGLKAKEGIIRASKLINPVHELVKVSLLDYLNDKFNFEWVSYPRIGATRPEIKLEGDIKTKNQDLMFSEQSLDLNNIEIEGQHLRRLLSVNVRSQLSSVAKNIDTLMERTFAEPIQLRIKYPDLIMGEVYMIPVIELNDEECKNNKVVFKSESVSRENINKFLYYFNKFTDRSNFKEGMIEYYYKYDATTLLIIDLESKPAKFIYKPTDLKKIGLDQEAIEKYQKLSPIDFEEKLVNSFNN
tara:strand:+ start:627 stop:1460 length:834 start_codon:yes stop_codon:yes gene_type:complete